MIDEKELKRLHDLKDVLPKIDKMMGILFKEEAKKETAIIGLLRKYLKEAPDDQYELFKSGFLIGGMFTQDKLPKSLRTTKEVNELVWLISGMVTYREGSQVVYEALFSDIKDNS